MVTSKSGLESRLELERLTNYARRRKHHNLLKPVIRQPVNTEDITHMNKLVRITPSLIHNKNSELHKGANNTTFYGHLDFEEYKSEKHRYRYKGDILTEGENVGALLTPSSKTRHVGREAKGFLHVPRIRAETIGMRAKGDIYAPFARVDERIGWRHSEGKIYKRLAKEQYWYWHPSLKD